MRCPLTITLPFTQDDFFCPRLRYLPVRLGVEGEKLGRDL